MTACVAGHHNELYRSNGSAGHRGTEQAAQYGDPSQLRYEAYAIARQGVSFHRKTGFSSAYIGSANLSTLPYQKVSNERQRSATMNYHTSGAKSLVRSETYWQDDEFRPIATAHRSDCDERSIRAGSGVQANSTVILDLQPYRFERKFSTLHGQAESKQTRHSS